jgi:hypothetical protein
LLLLLLKGCNFLSLGLEGIDQEVDLTVQLVLGDALHTDVVFFIVCNALGLEVRHLGLEVGHL